jgi:hypothetical protein
MVGVPGRSKGCNTCIRRKIRVCDYAICFIAARHIADFTLYSQCDQETPLCGNCRKSNRLCTGYKRRLGYVLSRDMSVTDLADPIREDSTVTYQGRWRRVKPQDAPCATYKPADPQQITADDSLSLSLGSQVSAVTAFRQQLHYLYLDYHLPAEMLDRSCPGSAASRNWLFQLQDVVIQSPALEASIAAFFAANIGRQNKDLDLVQKSRSM